MNESPVMSRVMQNDGEGHETDMSGSKGWLETRALLDIHRDPLYTKAVLAPPVATQNDAEAHDTDPSPVAERVVGLLQVVPLNVSTSPGPPSVAPPATAAQNEEDVHDTAVRTACRSMVTGDVHEVPSKTRAWPTGVTSGFVDVLRPTATQCTLELQETPEGAMLRLIRDGSPQLPSKLTETPAGSGPWFKYAVPTPTHERADRHETDQTNRFGIPSRRGELQAEPLKVMVLF